MNARPSDVAALNEIARAQLHRALLLGILRAKGVRTKLLPDELVTKAVTEGRGLELVRHLTALKRDGGKP